MNKKLFKNYIDGKIAQEEMPIIIEAKKELSDGSQGFYLNGTNVIVVETLNAQNVLIHECVHYLFDKKDKKLRKFLKAMNLDFNSKPQKVIKNRTLNNFIDVKQLNIIYEPYEFLNEALAYIIGESGEKLIRQFNIDVLNKILDGEFFYHDLEGNVFHYSSGLQITHNPVIQDFVDDLIKDGEI